ncbi:MAG: hypothetical protein ACLFT1_03715 [Desulfonatronovibrio sp.]
MKQVYIQGTDCPAWDESPGFPRESGGEPECQCFINQGNGMFALDISLRGPLDSPPFLARLYCRNGRLGRFRIYLKEERINTSVRLYGLVNVRYGDIIEWRNQSIRNLGLIDENGKILRLNMCHTCSEFNDALKKYLKTRQKQHIIKYLSV